MRLNDNINVCVFNPELSQYIQNVINEFDLIDSKRKGTLAELSSYLLKMCNEAKTAKLIFICTHNSRRSHFAQIWAQTAAYWYHMDGVETFSGGTEATAFYPNAVAALIRAGFLVENTSEGDMANPRYNVKPGEDFHNYYMFSKMYDDKRNPDKEFAAIMVCSDADQNCPFIPGADKRFTLKYEDPKAFDDTDKEAAMYDERCAQVAREMFYVFDKLKSSTAE